MDKIINPPNGGQNVVQKKYKYRVYPTKEQQILLDKTFGCCRFIKNYLLAESIEAYDEYKLNPNNEKPNVSGYGFCNRLVQLKYDPSLQWLNEISAVALQQAALDLGKAYSNFFKGLSGYPKFKSKRNHNSFRLVGTTFKLLDNDLFIIKSKDPIKVIWDRPLPSTPTSCTFTRTPIGEYYVSFTCLVNVTNKHSINTEERIAIDLGIKNFASLSSGEKLSNPKNATKLQKKLAKAQAKHARTKKGSNNREKARIKVVRIYDKINKQNNDYLHKLTTRLVNENQVIIIEDLDVAGMIEKNDGIMSKNIKNVQFGRFRQMLEYKVREYNYSNNRKYLIIVDRYFPSSQICHRCGSKTHKKLNLNDREWTCWNCHTVLDRDINASLNLENYVNSRETNWIGSLDPIIELR